VIRNNYFTLLTIAALLLMAACAKQPTQTKAPPPTTSVEHSLQTMLTGIDQFDGGEVWGLNTGHGTFVVGPEVSSAVKTKVYEHLMEARDLVIVIRYREIPANKDIVAHKRVTAIVIQETEYLFSR